MKTKTIASIAGASLLSISAFAQTPPAPPVPPVPPVAPGPPQGGGNHPGRDREPKVPVTWLGVETSGVPRVVSEQLGLAKGFGLVIDYVVPDGPAAAAGVQQSDILKMLNDQILTEPGQLAKLIRSYSEGTTITLTVLRKGAEQKLTVKLAKHEIASDGNMFGPRFEKHWENGHDHDTGMLNMDMSGLKELQKMDFSGIRETVQNARREAMRATEEARRRARELRVVSKDAGGMRSTRIDLAKAQVVLSDAEGEMKIETTNGKKMLTAKDPQGKLLFSGPVETKDELDKVPADVRRRYEKLEQKDLPAVAPNVQVKKDDDEDDDDDDNDADDDDDDRGDSSGATGMEQVSFSGFPQTVLI